MKLYATLTPQSSKGSTISISELIKQLENYKRDLENKTQKLIDRLLEVGIQTAMKNTGEYGLYIHFNKKFEGKNVGILIATDTKILRRWKTKEGFDGYEISPLLMAEFGSGWLAHVMQTKDYRSNGLGVGQGTMPEQTHAFDTNGWWWQDMGGETHHSKGEKPTYPMYSAMIAMLFEIDFIAKEVFNG